LQARNFDAASFPEDAGSEETVVVVALIEYFLDDRAIVSAAGLFERERIFRSATRTLSTGVAKAINNGEKDDTGNGYDRSRKGFHAHNAQ
jgi:hypothetical protein